MCILPIRCYTCNKVIGGKWDIYQNMLNDGIEPKDALDNLELKRICCRRMILGHVELIDNLLKYSEQINTGEIYVFKK
jgi:DNA-directed RNA polymerase I, II, and III subunit RPABC5